MNNVLEDMQGSEACNLDKTIIATFDYERSPLFFKTLEFYGFRLHAIPTIALTLNNDLSDFDRCVSKLQAFDFVVFSSPAVVKFFFRRLQQLMIAPTILDCCTLVAIGSATATCLRKQGFSPDFVPKEFTANSLINRFQCLKKRSKILIPCSNKSLWHRESNVLSKCKLFRPVLYTNNPPEPEISENNFDFLEEDFDSIVFTSPSSVEHLIAAFRSQPLAEILNNRTVACIGPTTSTACIERGIEVSIQPAKYTMTSLMWSIIHHYQAQSL